MVGEEALDLVVRGDAAGDVPAEAGREHDRADEERDEEGVDEAVLLQELVQPLVAAHPQHVPSDRSIYQNRNCEWQFNKNSIQQFKKFTTENQALRN